MRALVLCLVALPCPAVSDDLRLAVPVDCVLGETCHIQQGVDHDPGPGASDFRCGPQSYDGHTGTDFGLPTLAAQAAGVDVLAAAEGVVTAVRDGMPDLLQGAPGAPDVTGRACGNGVVVDHGKGWETQYCHMADGSVAVRTGDRVRTGDVLGRVGLSGNTEFPHMHLSVRKDGAEVDPFEPDGVIVCGAPSEATLWVEDVVFPEGALVEVGFALEMPTLDALWAGGAGVEEAGPDTPALVGWGLVWSGRAGDVVTIRIDGPGGEVIAHDEVLARTQAQLFRAAGKRRPEGGWPAGTYRARITLMRDGVSLGSRETVLEVVP